MMHVGRPDDEVADVDDSRTGQSMKITCHLTGGACAKGPPLRSGCAVSVSAGVLAGLKRSVETLSVLSPICIRNK
jgi:hypothetical protein